MRKEELRIGNLVNHDQVVVSVSPELMISFIDGTTDFSPIPLTNEWLKELDFEEVFYRDRTSRWFSNEVIEVELKKDDRFIFKTFELTSVHQLQNVYFDLTGDELSRCSLEDFVSR